MASCCSNVPAVTQDSHVQSVFLIVPFLAVSMSLLRLNWFPAKASRWQVLALSREHGECII